MTCFDDSFHLIGVKLHENLKCSFILVNIARRAKKDVIFDPKGTINMIKEYLVSNIIIVVSNYVKPEVELFVISLAEC